MNRTDVDPGARTPVVPHLSPHNDEQAGWTGWLDTLTPEPESTPQLDESSDTVGDDPAAAPPDGERTTVMAGPGSGADTPTSRAVRRVPRPRLGRGVVAAAGVAVLAGLAGAGIVLAGTGSDTAPAATVAQPAAEPREPSRDAVAAAAAAVGGWCPVGDDGVTVSGSGAGNPATGAGLVFALQYRMYVARDVDGVRALFAPSAAVAPVQQTREAIATIPAGTRHCARVRTVAPDRFAVAVTELHPDRRTQVWETTVSTGVQPDGRTLITAITPGAAS